MPSWTRLQCLYDERLYPRGHRLIGNGDHQADGHYVGCGRLFWCGGVVVVLLAGELDVEKGEVRLKEDPLTLGCGGVWSLMHSMGAPVAKPLSPFWTVLQQGAQAPGGVSGSRAQRRNSVLSQDCLNPTSRQCLRTSSPSSTSPSHAKDCDSFPLWLSPCPRIDAKPTRASLPPSIGSMPMRRPDRPRRPSSRLSPRENEKA